MVRPNLWLLSLINKILTYARRSCNYWDKRQIIMRLNLSLIFVVIAFFQASATGFAQRISLNEKNSSLEKVLETIRDQSGYVFMYNSEKLEKIKVSVTVKNSSIEQALDACLKDLPFSYKIVKNNILIKEKNVQVVDLKTVLNHQVQQNRKISGLVADTLGMPLPGVTVVVKNNNKMGTTTDKNGRYTLEVPDNAVLVFSMIGYNSQEIVVKEKTVINVVLQSSYSELDDVVVVAFGKQRKTEVVGAMTTINPSELKVPSSNLTTALAGRVAGMIAYQRSGEPGQDNADFFIRGVTTFGYKVDPLILIDGVEFTTNDLASLQVDDIASFSIMKDASSTALYGARGANGVIMVTTKQGKEGPVKVSFRAENSMSTPTKNVELADPITYMRMGNEAVLTRDPLAREPYSQSKIDNTILGTNAYAYPTTDWRKMLMKDYAMNQRYNLNVSGGGKVAQYYFAGTYNQDNGVLKVDKRNNFNNNIDLKNILIRSNVNVNITSNTQLGVRMYGAFKDYTGPLDYGSDLYKMIMRTNPVMFPAYWPVTDRYSYLKHIQFGGAQDGNLINPYAQLVRGYRDQTESLMMAQLELKHDMAWLTDGLNFRIMANTNRRSDYGIRRFYNPYYYDMQSYDKQKDDLQLYVLNERDTDSSYPAGTEHLNYNETGKAITSTFYMESALSYNKRFNNKHGVSGMLVMLMQEGLEANGGTLELSLPSRNLGVSGRFTYNYGDRYFSEFNFGYNGSERFSEQNRFGFFPSGGVAWQVSNEKFWKPFEDYVQTLKLRATYGLVGNDAIGDKNDRFFYLSRVSLNSGPNGAVFGTDWNYSNNGVAVSRYANPEVTWEIAYKSNFGLELKAFKNLSIQADYFTEFRKNILMTRAYIPKYLGLSADVKANLGEARAHGLDMSVDYNFNFNQDFWLMVRGNFTYSTNKYVKYEEAEYEKEYWKSRVGTNINQVFGYVAERLFVDDEEVANSPVQFGEVRGGDIKYRDLNNDGIISALDQVGIGNSTVPEIVYGFGFSSGYKKFDLSCFLQGLSQESFWIDPIQTAPFYNSQQLLKAYADSYWSESNSNMMAMWPRLSSTNNLNNSVTSTWFMRDGSFLRVKSVELGYTLSGPKLKNIGLNNIRVYGSGTNLFTFSKFKTWDVEMAGKGLSYPIQKVYNLGVQVSF